VTPDINVLVAASRGDHPHHAVAREWLLEASGRCADGASLRLLPVVVAGFLRLVTHPRVFRQPTPAEEAVAFLDAVLAVPGVELASQGPEWPLLRQLCLERNLAANAIPDAWLAAAVIQLGEHLVTLDADFRKLLRRGQVTVLPRH